MQGGLEVRQWYTQVSEVPLLAIAFAHCTAWAV